MVSSGTAAIEEARRLLPDLVVTDVLMPGHGGLQTLFVLRDSAHYLGGMVLHIRFDRFFFHISGEFTLGGPPN